MLAARQLALHSNLWKRPSPLLKSPLPLQRLGSSITSVIFQQRHYATNKKVPPKKSTNQVLNVQQGGSGGGGNSGRASFIPWKEFGILGVGLAVFTFVVYKVRNQDNSQRHPGSNIDRVPITNRTRRLAVPNNWEFTPEIIQKLDESYQEQLNEAKAQGQLLPQNSIYVNMCKLVLRKLLEANPELSKFPWDLNVLSRFLPTAVVTPHGKILVHTGMLYLLDSEDELAAVLAHEMAHVYARHFIETISDLNDPGRVLLEKITGNPRILHRSRRLEHEADHIGLILMANACYDVKRAPEVWKKIQKWEDDMKPHFKGDVEVPVEHRTHPPHEERYANVTKLLPEAQKIQSTKNCGYDNALQANIAFWEHIEHERERWHSQIVQALQEASESNEVLLE